MKCHQKYTNDKNATTTTNKQSYINDVAGARVVARHLIGGGYTF